jgi:outer membrane receptor protein involved in Fe transport
MAKRGSRRSPLMIAAIVSSLYLAFFGNVAQAQAQSFAFDLPHQPLAISLRDYARVSGQQIIFTDDLVAGKIAPPLYGFYSVKDALSQLLAGTGLVVEWSESGAAMIREERHAMVVPRDEPAAIIQTFVEEVVVSASRITADGFDAPTPTTVVSSADIQQGAQPTVFDTINQLPALQGSIGTQSNVGNFSLGQNGLSSFNLLGLGTIRTLTLIDGQRIVPANVSGVTDVNELPQLLIQRVDVVMGGASASWGSDAVGGVVNFVIDKKFVGVKGNIETGVSTYGDDASALIQIAAGTELFGDKGHVEGSIEFYHTDGVWGTSTPGGALPNGRCCNLNPGTLSYSTATTPAGTPEFSPILHAQSISASQYGLITAGPLKGIAFDASGVPTNFQYGAPCIGTTCVGGDQSNNFSNITVDNPLTRSVFYMRLSYDIAPNLELFGTFNLGNVLEHEAPPQGGKNSIPIACGNAIGGPNIYVPASINAACISNNITSFVMGAPFSIGPAGRFQQLQQSVIRQQRRYVIGADASFDMFGKNWSFDSYFQHGENDTSINVRNMWLNARFNAAVDAVAGPNGTIVCRSASAQASGCVPFNFMGGGAVSAAALNYMYNGTKGPYSRTSERQEVASFSINGMPFKDWAGNVAVAFGGEFREEAYSTTGDPYSAGVSAYDPNTAAYPADPLLDPVQGNNWGFANYHNGSGNYHVAEGFVEIGVPLFGSPQWGKADLDISGRATSYSTSGNVETWKVGTTWDTPIDGVRLRVLQSRDVRAPNLSELFATEIETAAGVQNRLLAVTAPNVPVLNQSIGNPDLKPETAQTTELGLVFQPEYIPNFNASIDYYRIALKKEIGTLNNQQLVDLCQLYGNTSYCSLFNLSGVLGTSNPPFVIIQPINLAQTVTDGFNIQARYRFGLQDWDVPGSFAVRSLVAHVSKFVVTPGIIGQPVAEYAGAQVTYNPSGGQFQAGLALWKIFLIQSWNNGPLSLDLTERFFSNGAMNPYGIECQAPNCPVPTAQNPTYSNNHVPGYLFVDVGGSYQIADGLQGYIKINNIADRLPKPFAVLNSDPVGRVYRVGLRLTGLN